MIRSTVAVEDNRPGYMRQREEDAKSVITCAVCGTRVIPHTNMPCKCFPMRDKNDNID